MAEPGDPTKTGDDFDDEIGFCSPRSIAGRQVEAPAVSAPAVSAPEPVAAPAPAPLFEAPPAYPPHAPEPEPELFAAWDSSQDAAHESISSWSSPEPAPAPVEAAPTAYRSRAERLDALHAEPKERLTWALTLYALILFAVPTLGFSAVIGLLAVTGRTVDASPLLFSHYVYQKRTLWAAAIAALAGLILIIVNLGVFVLFLLAIWTLLRGASGLWRLKNGQPISNPLSWLF